MTGPYAARLDALRAQMRETSTDLVVLGPSSHMAELAGLDPHGDERPVLLVVAQSDAVILLPGLNADAVRQHTSLPFHVWTDETRPRRRAGSLPGGVQGSARA
ncbi:MAG: hypothetical protein AAF646_10355 [Pseudomonadota bacterium]